MTGCRLAVCALACIALPNAAAAQGPQRPILLRRQAPRDLAAPVGDALRANAGVSPARAGDSVLTEPAPAIVSKPAPLRVIAVEGEGAFNDIKRKIARNPVIEVQDDAGKPVPGAEVIFLLPDSGAGGTFTGGSRRYVTTTDAAGRAAAKGLRPNATEGRFHIEVTAASLGRTGSAVISQSNTLAGGLMTAGKAGSGKKKMIILMAIAGGAAGGAYAGMHGGKSSTAAPAGPIPTTLSTGGVTVGGPR